MHILNRTGDGVDLFHATPRIVGTPMSSSNGPEKPQRQYAYEQHPPPSKKGVHFVDEEKPKQNGNGTQSQNRVRFQEPSRDDEEVSSLITLYLGN